MSIRLCMEKDCSIDKVNNELVDEEGDVTGGGNDLLPSAEYGGKQD